MRPIKKIISLFALLLLSSFAIAQIPSGYYNNALNKSGETLRAALRDISTSGHVKLPYTSSSFDVWDAYSKTDVRPGTTTIWDMYSDVPNGTPAYTFTLYSSQCGTAGAEGDCYSREHQVPNSWWGGLDDATHQQYTDLHHLPPADQYVNNYKSAHPIGKVGTATFTSTNGSKVGACAWPGYTGTVFEPIDEYKGDFARAYLYVATRYMNQLSSWVTSYPTTEAQYVINSTGNNYKQWFIDMLVQWSLQDPVSQKELDRNDAIYYNTPQHNRNPYIDHPEYVCMVWSSSSCVSGPVISSVAQSPLVATATSPVSITATVTSSIGVSSVTVEWGTDGVSFSNSIATVQTTGTNDFVTATAIPAQTSGSTVYYRVIAEDIQSNVTTSSVRNYTVLKDEPTNYPTGFSCGTTTGSSITLTWTDATGASVPDGYVIKASSVSAASITAPSDSVTLSSGSFVKIVNPGVQQAVFSGLGSSTTYYFKIYPYTNSGTNINYKTNLTPPLVSCTTTVSTGGSSCATDLIISEYVEGSSNNKYIEIYNNTGAAVNLSDYKLQLYTNGSATVSNEITLSGTLNNLGTVVYKNGSATIYTGTATTASSVINFNGDDAVALYKISTASYVDIFGRIGEDPGTNWTGGTNVTLDKTLVRNADVFSGVTINPSSGFPTLSSQWTQYNIDVVSNLGTHSMSCSVCASPVTASSNVSFSSVTQNSFTINWTNGDGAKRLVVVKDSSAANGTPNNGSTYAANASFGSGDTLAANEYVISNGSGTSASVTNLLAGHTYFATVFEYNCAVGSQLYLTPGVTASKTTYSITTGAPSDIQFCVSNTVGASASVDFTSTGTFSSNTYSVQLSDSSGSFTSPVTIGSFVSNAASATINCIIPANSPSGTGYRMRVVSSNPSVIGTSTDVFEVILSPTAVAPTSISSDRNGFCSTDSGNITLAAVGGSGSELSWYSGSCGGTFLGTGNPLVIPSPISSTTYYAYWSTLCSTSSCTSVTVSVSGLPTASPGSAIASCSGSSAITMTGATNAVLSNVWSGGASLGSWTQSTNPSLAVFTPSVSAGSFIATLIVYSSGGCTDLSVTYTRKISWGSSGSWIGASSNDWFTAGNWCGGVPSGATSVSIPPSANVLYSPIINNSSASCLNLTLEGMLTIGSGQNLDVYGNWTNNGGSLDSLNGTVTFRGQTKTISGGASTAFPAVKFNSGSSYTLSSPGSCLSFSLVSGSNPTSVTLNGSPFTVYGNASVPSPSGNVLYAWNINSSSVSIGGSLTIGSGSSNSSRISKVALTSGTLSVAGNLTFSTSVNTCAQLDLSGGAAVLNLGGTLTRSSAGYLNPGTQSTVNFQSATVSQTIPLVASSISFNNILLNNASASGAILGGVVTSTNVTGNILIQSGLFSNGGYAVAGGSTRQFSIGAGTTYKLLNATVMPTGFGTLSISPSSTVEFGGSSGQTIAALNYGNLISSGTGSRTLASSGTIGIAGAFTPGSNTYTTTGSTINFNGADQSIPSFNSTTGYNNLTVTQSSGMARLTGDVTVAGTLNMASGNMDLSSFILLLKGSAAISGSPFSVSKMIIADGGGEIRKNVSANGSYLFPVGDNTGTMEYSPITVSYSSGTYAAGAYYSLKLINAKHPQNSNGNNYINRYWVVKNSSVTSPVYSVDATYLAADVAGSETGIYMARYSGSLPWTKHTIANTTTKSLTASSVSVSGESQFTGMSFDGPSVTITGGGVSFCAGDSVQLTANASGVAPFTYSWSPSSGLSATNVANPKASPSGNTTYTVTVTDANGLSAVATASVTILAKPVVSVSASGPTTFCFGSSVALTASGGGTYLWNTGLASSVLTVGVSGSYTVTVTGANGCSAVSPTTVVSVNQSSQSTTTMAVCTSQLPITWNNNQYNSAGTYQVYLTNAAGCDSVATLQLTVNPITSMSSSVVGCNYYILPWGDTAWVNGVYSHIYPGANSFACDSVVTLNVLIRAFTASIEAWKSPICDPDSAAVIFHYAVPVLPVSIDFYIYNYNPDNSGISATFSTNRVNKDTLVLPGMAVGSHNIALRAVTDANGCKAILSSDSITTIVIKPAPVVSFTGLPATACTNTPSVLLTGNQAGGVFTGSGITDNQNGTASFSAGAAGVGVHKIKYSFTNAQGCSGADSQYVQVFDTSRTLVLNYSSCGSYSLPDGQVITATGSYSKKYQNVNGCDSVVVYNIVIYGGTHQTFFATACGSYSWYSNVYTQSGDYVHQYLNSNGCASADTLHLVIYALPDAGIISGPSSVCLGNTITLNSSAAGGVWSSGNTSVATIGSASGIVNPVAVGSATIRYIGNSAYCGKDTAYKLVTVLYCNSIVTVKAIIQGYYAGAGLMTSALYNVGEPGAQANMTDSVDLEIHDSATGDIIAGPVRTILFNDGFASAVFPPLNGSHYIVFKHRNAIETWSAQPVRMAPAVQYDFTSSADKAYGDNMVLVDPGVYAIWSGDLNQDGMIEAADFMQIENEVLQILFGYYISDLTGDGVVEAEDYSLMENNILRIIFALKPF